MAYVDVADLERIIRGFNDRIRALEVGEHQHLGTAWIALPFATNWQNYGGLWQVGQYYKDSLGWVRLRGLVQKTTSGFVANDLIATLPAGYRPPAYIICMANCEGKGIYRIDIATNGEIRVAAIIAGTPNNDYVSLEGIAFKVT